MVRFRDVRFKWLTDKLIGFHNGCTPISDLIHRELAAAPTLLALYQYLQRESAAGSPGVGLGAGVLVS